VTPTLSVAVAATVTEPLTVAPSFGAVRDTDGAFLSRCLSEPVGLFTTRTVAVLDPERPSTSYALACRVW
jgi:hypothetical protein